jgi:hypothetical protein
MKNWIAASALMLSGCTPPTLQWTHGPEVSEATCTASCNAHFDECPRIFADFPERGAVECPAERDNCLKTCQVHHAAARPPAALPVAPASAVPAAPVVAVPSPAPQGAARAAPSKEARLRELKRLYDEGLVSDDVYRHRQEAILAEP